MKKIKISIFVFLVVSFLSGTALFFSWFSMVDIGGHKFIARLATTPEEHRKGLSGRKSMCRNCAMLFDFEEKGKYSFWMKDMRFDLDIIWMDDSRIVYIKKNFSRFSEESFEAPVEAKRVLEINSGLSDEYGFKVGDEVKIMQNPSDLHRRGFAI